MLGQIIYAISKHDGQKRIGGEPYILHPLAVAKILELKGFIGTYIIIAIFHDLFEDTNATEEEILNLSNEECLVAVKLLTKVEGYVMQEYIDGIRNNEKALIPKLADRLHNLRSAFCTNEKFKKRLIKETEDWYLELSRGTVFEEDIQTALNNLKISMKK